MILTNHNYLQFLLNFKGRIFTKSHIESCLVYFANKLFEYLVLKKHMFSAIKVKIVITTIVLSETPSSDKLDFPEIFILKISSSWQLTNKIVEKIVNE